MALLEKQLENQLVEAGNKLLSTPSSVSELLALLDRVEGFLTRVEQSPSESMSTALSPSIKAIAVDALLKHSSDDVKVTVASCINEIIRITAPNTPYEDELMKDVFKLIVSSFKKIDDQSSPSYVKRTIILETVAEVRSCVVMLDLECDGLILEMFQIFLRSIRDYHPENVFSSMETIMTLVFEESEDVSLDLVSSILDFLKTENKEALPIAVRLAEKVVEKCASKLKPYLIPAVESRGASLNDYSKVVANVCLVPPEAVEPIEGDAVSKNMVLAPHLMNALPLKASMTRSKRKRSSGKEKIFCGTKNHGELVGSKIKVWWPGDQKFYYAVVESFDSVNMKHKVIYYNGDVEKLTLAKEKWKLIDDATSNQSSSGTEDYGEELVGSKIKVWWPADKKFYYAVVESFDSVNMKHKVVYYDGDVEKLTLAKEKWRRIDGDAMSHQPSSGTADYGEALVGSQIKVWWPGDQKFYYAVVESFDSVNMKHKSFFCGTKDHGKELVGSKIKVWWPLDQKFCYAVVESFDSVKMTHKVVYYDGYVEIMILAKEKWKLIEGDAMSDQEECTSDGESPDGVSETPKSKKVKTCEDLRTKHGKVETTPRTNTKPEQSSQKGKEAQEKEKLSSEAPETDAMEKPPCLWKIQKKRKSGGKRPVTFLPPIVQTVSHIQ